MLSSWAHKSVLVTGAGGFIGSHLAGRLVESGARVRALVRYTSQGSLGALRWEPAAGEVEVRFGDVRDPESVRAAIPGCDAVFHLAALGAIPYSYLAPREVVETNVIGTLNVLSAAREAAIDRTICLSSSEVYGTPESVPIDESHPLRAQSPYAASKVAADQLARSFSLSYGVQVGIARLFNIYGPRQSARAVIPTILTQAIAGLPVKLGSLHPVRDLTFVDDAVAALLAFGAWDEMDARTLHFGSGEAVSVSDLVVQIGSIIGRELAVETEAERVRPEGAEVERLVSDSSAARSELDWRPSVTLRDGLSRTADWIEANLDSYRPERYAL